MPENVDFEMDFNTILFEPQPTRQAHRNRIVRRPGGVGGE
jgi:hypothetical protein